MPERPTPYIAHGSIGEQILADLDDFTGTTALTVEACLALPTDDDPTDWVPASWHPDRAATIIFEYAGDLPPGWRYFWSRVSGQTKYRHGRVRLT